jgi:chromate reductase, NAD(P)H dehydrogenase (quinone)
MTFRLLGLCESLRKASTNMALLQAARLLAPPSLEIMIWAETGSLPHFNPDDEADALPPEAIALRTAADQSHGLLIACPEYARGIPGTFKNALDWLVGSEQFSAKPIALLNASPRAHAAQDALRLVLTTMAAQIIEDACATFPLIATSLTPAEIAQDELMARNLRKALHAYADALSDLHSKQPAR